MGIVSHVSQKIKDLEAAGVKVSNVKLGEKEASFRSIDPKGRIRNHYFKPKVERIEADGELDPTEIDHSKENAPVKRGRGRPKKRA